MSEIPDDRLELAPLASDVSQRVSRIAIRLADQIAVARSRAAQRIELWDVVQRRLARVALPAAVAAAVSLTALFLSGRNPTPPPERFAAVVVERGPARPWLVLGRRPEIPELVAMLGNLP